MRFLPKFSNRFLAGFLVWIFVSCSTQRQVTQLVEHTSVDTIYINQTQYDSIFIKQDHSSDYHLNPSNLSSPSNSDTLFIKDVSIEYRYRLLRDTVRIHKVDSIPVIKEVEVIKTGRYYKSAIAIAITIAIALFVTITLIRRRSIL